MTVIVDLHQHVIPDCYLEASNEGGNAAGGINPQHWSLDGASGRGPRATSTTRRQRHDQ